MLAVLLLSLLIQNKMLLFFFEMEIRMQDSQKPLTILLKMRKNIIIQNSIDDHFTTVYKRIQTPSFKVVHHDIEYVNNFYSSMDWPVSSS